MLFSVLTCPQCAAPLPRQASWRMVACPYCTAIVTRSKSVVEAARFHEAKARVYAQSFAAYESASRVVHWHDQRFSLLTRLGLGENGEVFLAERMSPLPQRVTLKIAHQATPPGTLAAEAEILQKLRASQAPGAAYFTQRLPQLVGVGMSEGTAGYAHEVLILRHPSGYWGSLADVLHYAPSGIDARHAVWIWRRILDVLAFVHDSGWTHGDLAPEHLLMHPRDHGVLIIGWSKAQADVNPNAVARDLMQTAWTIRALLGGDVDSTSLSSRTPGPINELLRQCSEDAGWCARTGAHGIDQALLDVALGAFGPPKFIPFNPTATHHL